MTVLVIAEKPSVARDIARVIGAKSKKTGYIEGNGYQVTWCVGHLLELCEPQDYDRVFKRWSIGLLPIIPAKFKLRPIQRSQKQLTVVGKLLRQRSTTEIINACDAGREGELIFRRVYQYYASKKPVKRLWISSLTAKAIATGMQNLQPSSRFDGLGDAAMCRSEADWLVGINGTRAMTSVSRKAGGELMSVGRVQTPTLAMLVRREDEIDAFVPKAFWEVDAFFEVTSGSSTGAVYRGTWVRDKTTRLASEKEARAIADAVQSRKGNVEKVQIKRVRERPPQLFDLTTLQKVANRRLRFSAKRTLQAAQRLYESYKLLTYPRTDSRCLTSDMVPKLPNIVRNLAVGPYAELAERVLQRGTPTNRRLVNNTEVGDHHAIIPTGLRPNLAKLGGDDKAIFDLVVRRFLAVFLPDAVFENTRIQTLVIAADETEHRFSSKGRTRLDWGWHLAEPPSKRRQNEEKTLLPKVNSDTSVVTKDVTTREGTTEPPRRYSEADLLSAMERAGRDLDEAELRRAMKRAGLGTPSTRAATIETLLKRDYIRRDKQRLLPTAQGRALVATVPVEDLKSPQLTGQWEARLSAIADGREDSTAFGREIQSYTRSIVEGIKQLDAAQLTQLASKTEAKVLGRCPVCGTEVSAGRRAYTCRTGKDCSFVIFKTIAGRKVSENLVRVLLGRRRSQKLKGFRSKKGKRFSAALVLNNDGVVEFDFGKPKPQAKTAGSAYSKQTPSPATPVSVAHRTAVAKRTPAARQTSDTPASGPKRAPRCPRCNTGRIIRGNRGWGCSRWREGCKFVVWEAQGQIKLPVDEADRLFRKKQTRLMDGLMPDRKARLVLDLSVEGNVRVEPTKRKRRGD